MATAQKKSDTDNRPQRRGGSTSTGKLPALRMATERVGASRLQRIDGIPVVTFAIDVARDPEADPEAEAVALQLEELEGGTARLLIRGHRSDVAALAGALTRSVLAELDGTDDA